MHHTLSKRLVAIQTTADRIQSDIERLSLDVESAHQEAVVHRKAHTLLQEAASSIQNSIEAALTSLCTKALQDVFTDKHISFGIAFVPQKNTTNVEMWIEEDGVRYDPLESRGHGLADMLAFALRVSVLALQPSLRRVLIMDEPFTRISQEYLDRAIEFVKLVSKETGIQVIMVTHLPALAESADKSFYVSIKNGISMVEEL